MFVSHKSTVVVIISPIKSPFIVQVVLLIMAWFMFDVVVLNLAWFIICYNIHGVSLQTMTHIFGLYEEVFRF